MNFFYIDWRQFWYMPMIFFPKYFLIFLNGHTKFFQFANISGLKNNFPHKRFLIFFIFIILQCTNYFPTLSTWWIITFTKHRCDRIYLCILIFYLESAWFNKKISWKFPEMDLRSVRAMRKWTGTLAWEHYIIFCWWLCL